MNFDKYTVTLPDELFDFVEILQNAADSGKYEPDNWLKPDGKRCSHKDCHASMFRHVANSSSGIRIDKDSKMDHLLHLAIDAMMYYTRLKKGIVHPDDEVKEVN